MVKNFHISEIYLAILHTLPDKIGDRRVHPQRLVDHRLGVTHSLDGLVVDLAAAPLQDVRHLGVRSLLNLLQKRGLEDI